MKPISLLALLVLMFTTVAAQTPSGSSANSQCTLSVSQLPEIRGLRLGMSAEELAAAFPDDSNRAVIAQAVKESKRADKYGSATLNLAPSREAPSEKFSGVSGITVELFDERVVFFSIHYADGPEWNDVDQFLAKVAESFHLPTGLSWVTSGSEFQKAMTCDGFAISVFATRNSSSPSLMLTDTAATKIKRERRDAAKEKARQAFKP